MIDRFGKYVLRKRVEPDLAKYLDHVRIRITNAAMWNVHDSAVLAPLLFDLEYKLLIAPAGAFYGEAGLVRVGGRQGNFDAGDQFGDAPGDLDQAEADGVELGVVPERCPGRQAAQGQHQPVRGGVDQQPELVGGGLGAGGAVGSKMQLVSLDQRCYGASGEDQA